MPYIEVVAGDFETNVLNIALTDGTPYSLDELSAEIVFAKPDRTTVVQDKSNGVRITVKNNDNDGNTNPWGYMMLAGG